MATSLPARDLRKVHDLLGRSLERDASFSWPLFVTTDRWAIRISGWTFRGEWRRSFLIWDIGAEREGHLPDPEGDPYEGRGWPTRMAADILSCVEGLRRSP